MINVVKLEVHLMIMIETWVGTHWKSVYWCRQAWSSSRQQSRSDRTSGWTRPLHLLVMVIMITLQEQGGYLVSFLLCINPLDTAVHLLCSCTFLHFWSFANPQNPASYFPDRDAAKKPTIHFLTNIYMFKFRQLQFATWKNTFKKIKNTHVFFFI